MKIMFVDWTIAMAPSNARQYDDNVWALDLTGELPEGWTWAALIAQGEHLDIIGLTPNEAGASAALTAAQLSLDGYYTIQVRGTKGDQVRHTNLVQAYVPRSLSGDANWPTLPTEFSQAEARITAASAHPPIPGEDGYWQIWDVEAGEYKPSDTPVPGGSGGGTNISLGLTSATVGQIAKITEVDPEGKPTKWEPVDLPSGGEWEKIADITLTEGASVINIPLVKAYKTLFVWFKHKFVESTTYNYFSIRCNDVQIVTGNQSIAAGWRWFHGLFWVFGDGMGAEIIKNSGGLVDNGRLGCMAQGTSDSVIIRNMPEFDGSVSAVFSNGLFAAESNLILWGVPK